MGFAPPPEQVCATIDPIEANPRGMTMNERFRQMVIEKLRRGEALPTDWARALFPPEKREYELVYYDKEREEDILAGAMVKGAL